MTDRTVLRVALDSMTYGDPQEETRAMFAALGVDSNMSFDQFQRALEIGLRVVRRADAIKGDDL